MAKVKARKDGIVLDDRNGVEAWLEGMDGCTLIRGHARFEGPHTCASTTSVSRPTGSSSTSAAARWRPTSPGCPRSTT